MPVKCKECGKSLSSQTALARHTASTHPEQATRIVWCERCTPRKAFAFHSDLAVHISAVHDGLRAFQCKICKRRFSRRSHLVSHGSAVHQQAKRFSCSICGKAMRQNGHMLTHIRKEHPDEVAAAGGDASSICIRSATGQDDEPASLDASSQPATGTPAAASSRSRAPTKRSVRTQRRASSSAAKGGNAEATSEVEKTMALGSKFRHQRFLSRRSLLLGDNLSLVHLLWTFLRPLRTTHSCECHQQHQVPFQPPHRR
jgi:hypothetical protein